jgi:hypothetical protein
VTKIDEVINQLEAFEDGMKAFRFLGGVERAAVKIEVSDQVVTSLIALGLARKDFNLLDNNAPVLLLTKLGRRVAVQIKRSEA